VSIGIALVVSADAPTIQRFSQALQELSLSPDVCREPQAAQRLLNCRKFEAVIVDLALGEPAASVLSEVRLSPSNRTAVTFVIAGQGETAALRSQSGFVFERPVTAQSIRRTLKPAYGLILRERRRYFRFPICLPVVIARAGLPPLHCQSVNISEGGMALSTFVPLRPGEQVEVQFVLPDCREPFRVDSTVCWWKTGHLGVRFASFLEGHKPELQVWLAEKLEAMLPDFVAQAFQRPPAAD
jgi:hypothetical protein